MTAILMETRLKDITVKTMLFGSTYETFATDKYGRRFRSFQVNNQRQAKRNHQKLCKSIG